VILPLPGGEDRGEGGRGLFPQGLDSAFLKWEENWNFLNKINHFHKKGSVKILVALDFPVGCIAGFPTHRPFGHRTASRRRLQTRSADILVCRSADFPVGQAPQKETDIGIIPASGGQESPRYGRQGSLRYGGGGPLLYRRFPNLPYRRFPNRQVAQWGGASGCRTVGGLGNLSNDN
jgi:hypothetical protein